MLGWRDAASFTSGAPADLVIGQPDFLSSLCNGAADTVSASSLCSPAGLAVDGSGNLYVADSDNNRVLEYANPFTACAGVFPCVGGAANLVLGQGRQLHVEYCKQRRRQRRQPGFSIAGRAGRAGQPLRRRQR